MPCLQRTIGSGPMHARCRPSAAWGRLTRKSSRAPSVQVHATAQPMGAGDGCTLFEDSNGKLIQPMCADYGFRSGTGRLYQEQYGAPPKGILELAQGNFNQELVQMRQYTRFGVGKFAQEGTGFLQKLSETVGDRVNSALGELDFALEGAKVLPVLSRPVEKSDFVSKEWEEIRVKLSKLKLDNKAIAAVEEEREKRGEVLETPLWVKAPFLLLCLVLDVLYEGKPMQKFWVLETVARIPYFAYISILHLYESIGFWRAGAELRKVHFAEEWNEMHHLQIMESLGGDQSWFDRFVGQHSAIAYYWLLIFFYLVNPKLAYNFMQRVELHARDTYAVFLEDNKALLQSIPPPKVALSYYLNEDLYLFDEFQKDSHSSPRRPQCNNLLDVFVNIRDDENEHVKTMIFCQQDSLDLDTTKNGNGKV